MAYDYKKEFRDLYQPKMKPAFVDVPAMTFVVVAGGESPAGHRASAAFDGTALLDVLDADGDIPAIRLHHEIYLGDPRKTKPENLKTVIRHPVRAREAQEAPRSGILVGCRTD